MEKKIICYSRQDLKNDKRQAGQLQESGFSPATGSRNGASQPPFPRPSTEVTQIVRHRSASILCTMAAHSLPSDQGDAPATEAATFSSLYSFLALTMRYPDPAFCNEPFFDAFESLLASLDWPAELAELRTWRKKTADPLDDLRTAYTSLFITAAPGTTIPPYASVYLDGDGSLHGRTTERTRDFYRERGFDLRSETEPADHIQFELEFLAALAGEAMFDDEELFLQTLFRPWFVRFQEKSMQEARHPFYRVSIQLIDFFTKEEQ